MKVQVMGIGGGCEHYRLRLPASCLADDIEFLFSGNVQVRYDDPRRGSFVEAKPIEDDVDVLVLQRPLTRYIVEAIPMLQAKGVGVVVELDDDIDAIESDHVSYGPVNDWGQWHHRDELHRAVKMADVVTVSTQALAEVYGRGVVLPNYIDARWLDIQREEGDTLVMGWTGQTTTHPGDLQVAAEAIQRIYEDEPFEFRNVGGDQERVSAALGIPVTGRPWAEFEDYPKQVAEFDIGVVPLHDRPFNASKSWLKGLEYAALGIPFVASPVREYKLLAQRGAGVLASNHAEWHVYLRTMMHDASWRQAMGEEARAAAAELTIQAHAWQWAEVWESARRRQ